ncbi:LacI family DNA-binding transcriptional regulator [Mollicutes bacterium LVI A0039]|nr:LacI family DNA-binding transcriptional regulator [Mollicutes bacterium LVI A0039]
MINKNKDNSYKALAEHAGVSTKTVSRYFTNPDIISEKTKQKLQQAIIDIDFVENKIAKSLAKGDSEYIGIIVPTLELSFFSDILNRIINHATSFNYKCIVYVSDQGPDKERTLINELRSYQVKGIINFSHILRSSELEMMDMNFVGIEREIGKFNYIVTDNYRGGFLATQHLIQQGCDYLIHINSHNEEYLPSHMRINGFKDASINVAHELFFDEIITVNDDNGRLKNYLKDKITKHSENTIGIFCANDNIARIILNYLVREGYEVPNKIKVIGFDNSQITTQAILSISTINQNLDLMAKTAVEWLIDGQLNQRLIIDPDLIVRETTNK